MDKQETEKKIDKIIDLLATDILNYAHQFNWMPCEESLPEGNDNEIPCLVTCREWNIFDGCWGRKEIRIISFITNTKTWNTKSDVSIDAWMYLPNPYTE